MAGIKELETALINADKAGDVAAARTLAAAIRSARSSTVGKMPSMDPTEGMSTAEKFLAGAGKGMTDVARGVGQAVGLVNQDSIDAAKAQDAALMKTGAGMAGAITGGVAATLPTLAIPGAGTLTGSAAIGAGTGLLAPVASDESRIANTALGATGGAVGNAAARGLSMLAQPIQGATEAAKDLLKRGIVPTPGMASGPTSIVNKVEQQLESFGPIGWLISHARGRAVKEMNVEAISKAVPNGEEVLKAGRPAIDRAGQLIDAAYDRVYDKIPGKITFDSTFDDAIKALPSK